MVSFPFTGTDQAPAVRRPLLEISFGGGAGSSVGSLASAAAGALGVGGADAWKQFVTDVTLEAGFAPSVDTLEVYLSAGEQAPAVAVGDTGSVSLGYEDSATELVFTGEIESVRYSAQGVTCITATNGGAKLSKLRVNQSYEQQKAGDIVSDLTGRADVGTDKIKAGVSFPYYVVDDCSNAFQHIAALASKCGNIAYFTPEGKLSFVPFAATRAAQTFAYGIDILSLHATEAVPIAGDVTSVGEGAAGTQGQNAWNWLLKDPSSVKGSAGSGKPERLIQDGSLRNRKASQSAADGFVESTAWNNFTGKLHAQGAPAVVVGSAIEITGAPVDMLNGLFGVRRVRHHFSKLEGFTTLIVFNKTGGGGLAGGLL